MPRPTIPTLVAIELRGIVDQDLPAHRLVRRPVEQQVEHQLVVGRRGLAVARMRQFDAHSMRSGARLTSARASTDTSSYFGAPVFDVSYGAESLTQQR